MKILLLTAALLTATGAVAVCAPTDETAPTAETQFQTSDFMLAQKAIEDALALARTDAEKAETLTRLGNLFDNQESYDEARAAYQRALPLVADSPDDLMMTRLFIATTYVNQKQWQNAADSWMQLMPSADSPQMKTTYQLALAQAYTELNQTDKAREQLERLRAQMAPVIADKAAQADERGFALILVGRSYQTENNLDAARQNFEDAAQLADASSDLRVNALKSLAEVAQKQGGEAAVADVRQRMMNEASQHFADKQWPEAVSVYREAAQLGTPDAVDALSLHWQIGNALRAQGDIDGARIEFQGVVEMAPAAPKPMFVSLIALFKPFSYYYLAQGYVAQGKFDLARAALDAELALPDLQAPVRKQAQEMRKGLPA